ncbi:MAG: hypothetical protein JW943_11800 [Deltaproteobacteria bacterium]|nr:hypothetical protein [Deltaproteobacteria bacterium]
MKKALIFASVFMIAATGMLISPGSAPADQAMPSLSAQAAKTARLKKQAAHQEEATRFYQALERLFDRFGEDHALWPDTADRRLIEQFLLKKDALTLNNCIFGRNLLGLGMGETSEDAQEALRKGTTDAWGRPYSLILAGSNKAPKVLEILFGIGVNRGHPTFNRNICEKVFVFLKADLHSLFADIIKNFNGTSVLFLAREIHIIGAPGSTEAGYEEKLAPALCAADSLGATVYIGDDDPVTMIIPRSFKDKMFSFFGMNIPPFKGIERSSDECADKKPPPVKMIHLTDCGHDMSQYYPGIKKFGGTLLRSKNTSP